MLQVTGLSTLVVMCQSFFLFSDFPPECLLPNTTVHLEFERLCNGFLIISIFLAVHFNFTIS